LVGLIDEHDARLKGIRLEVTEFGGGDDDHPIATFLHRGDIEPGASEIRQTSGFLSAKTRCNVRFIRENVGWGEETLRRQWQRQNPAAVSDNRYSCRPQRQWQQQRKMPRRRTGTSS